MWKKKINVLPWCLIGEVTRTSLGEDGWNELLHMTQAELRARPDDVYLNIRLVALYHSHNKLRDAVLHIQEAENQIPLETSLELCSCVVKTQDISSSFDPVTIFRTHKTGHSLLVSFHWQLLLKGFHSSKGWKSIEANCLMGIFFLKLSLVYFLTSGLS